MIKKKSDDVVQDHVIIRWTKQNLSIVGGLFVFGSPAWGFLIWYYSDRIKPALERIDTSLHKIVAVETKLETQSKLFELATDSHKLTTEMNVSFKAFEVSMNELKENRKKTDDAITNIVSQLETIRSETKATAVQLKSMGTSLASIEDRGLKFEEMTQKFPGMIVDLEKATKQVSEVTTSLAGVERSVSLIASYFDSKGLSLHFVELKEEWIVNSEPFNMTFMIPLTQLANVDRRKFISVEDSRVTFKSDFRNNAEAPVIQSVNFEIEKEILRVQVEYRSKELFSSALSKGILLDVVLKSSK